MTKRPGLPSRRSRGTSTGAASAARVDVRGWLGGVRLSAFMLIMLGLVVFGVLVLVPTISTYVGQQQRIAALKHEVSLAEDRVAELSDQRDKWQDSSFVMTQARERLYYYKPGELSYIVIDDLDATQRAAAQEPVSAKVTQTSSDWMNQLLRSVTEAGTSQMVTSESVPAPVSPAPTPAPATTPAE